MPTIHCLGTPKLRSLSLTLAFLVGSILGAGVTSPLSAQEARSWQQQRWGLGFTFRTANIPFATEEKTVATLIPLVMYEGKWVYFHETEGGIKFELNDKWRLSAMGRMHFFDIPTQYQNDIQGDRVDWGGQVRYRPWTDGALDFELLSDRDGNVSSNLRLENRWVTRALRLDAWGQASYKTSSYNTTFWGLEQENVDAGVDLTVGANGYLHVISSLYLQAAFIATYLSKPAREASLVEDNFHVRATLGFGLSNPRFGEDDRDLETSPYWRFSYQWGTPSALAEVIRFQAEPDPFNSRLFTVFYGLPLTDELFTLPIHIYLHSGLGLHFANDYQPTILEGVVSIKAYYTIPLPWRLRIGAAEGVSLVTQVPAREAENIQNYVPSEYLNYLDFSFGLNIGDIFNSESLEKVWFGYYIHHRSAIFETAQQFGRIKGGSNFQGLYVTIQR